MAKQPKETKNASAANAKGTGKSGDNKPGRLKQVGMMAKVVHQQSPKSIPIAVGVALLVLALAVLGGLLTGAWLYWVLMALPVAFLAGFIVFTRSAQRIQYKMLEGQLGGGMAVLENMRGNWTVEPAVTGSRQMDVVHRVVGRPGVILVGEGAPDRLRGLIAGEKKRVARVANSTPIYDMQVGNEKGQVPISKLQRSLTKLPRNLNKAETSELRSRLKAMPASMQMPKGPMPKGAKMPKGPKPQKGS